MSDLTAQARVWLGILALTIATGFVGAIAAGLIETGSVHGGRVQEGLSSTSAAVIMFTSVTALIVLSSTANVTVALQQRSYALWQLVGIRPALVGMVVLTQLGIVGALGALIGCLVAIPVFPSLFTWAFREWSDMQGISLHLGIVSMLIVVATITVVVMIGGLRGVRRASRTPPIEALRDPEPPRVRMGWFRILLTVTTLGGAVALAWNLDGSATLSGFSGQAILLTPLLTAALAAAGPLVLPFVLHAWTSLLPAKMSASWFLARHSARYRLSQSHAAISPLMVAIALSGGLYTTAATLDAALVERNGSTASTGLAPEGVVILLGGPLLLSAVAAAATVFMSGRAREREFALIQAAGSTQPAITLTAIWEAAIYAVTAAILGALATVAGGLVIAAKLSLPVPVVSFSTIGLIAFGGFVLILAATVAPTIAALRHEIPRTLAVE
ncbi:FtsX-like permease family protein [Microbacterium ulmi]|uniref:ABC transporter permease n=1 Tax=Microbacterium ulmi TaxID=179095 RepID=A0A7Y2Q041_9MICO|nr:ABC transporter permease [Microbacterium ulmi]NII69125.1 putative ABC transport system permease protein [Microbacterium ulmi]NNH05156.1 ABC transporter permease [Microbacterium ulmi]